MDALKGVGLTSLELGAAEQRHRATAAIAQVGLPPEAIIVLEGQAGDGHTTLRDLFATTAEPPAQLGHALAARLGLWPPGSDRKHVGRRTP